MRGLAFLRIFSAYLCFGNELKHFLNICNVFTFYFIVGSRFPRPIQSSQQKFIFQPMVSNCKQSSLAESVQKSLQNSRHVCSHSADHIYSRHFHRTVQTIAFPIWRFCTLKNKHAQFLHFLCNVQQSAFCNRLLKFKFLTVKFSYTWQFSVFC